MIKLFASDLDYTMLVGGRVPEENRLAMRRLVERGVHIAFVSGRCPRSVAYLAEVCDFPVAVVGANGAYAESASGERLYEQPMSPDSVRGLIRAGEATQTYFHFYDAESLHAARFDPKRYRHLVREETPAGTRYHCDIHISDRLADEVARYRPLKFQYQLVEESGNRVQMLTDSLKGLARTYSGHGFFELMDERVNKWETVRILAAHHGIRPEEICCCGDYLNDLEMVRESGFGVAMGNALDELKAVADFVTSDFDHYGIARAIEHLIATGRA